MDRAWQAFLGLQQPTLPPGFHTEHFTHEDLLVLVDAFCGGNVLSEPTSIGTFAETFYHMKDFEEFSATPTFKALWRDGLDSFLTTAWAMILKKKENK